jgi:hypothetical protein
MVASLASIRCFLRLAAFFFFFLLLLWSPDSSELDASVEFMVTAEL